VRGDEVNYKKMYSKDRSVNEYAIDLVKQINDLNQGKYLDDIISADPIDMSIGVGGYPEKHFESPNLKTDIQYLKQKVDAGADYIVTQMFFDNSVFFEFVKSCRDAGITVPIVPGIKILNKVSQLSFIPKNFFVNIPETLVEEMMENKKHVREIGTNWSYKQCEELLNHGIEYIHFYIMNDTMAVTQVMDKLRK
jgi:methylenetetrahydrofolate reductase (NADPH)